MTKFLFLLTLACTALLANAQNLVVNPGFEEYEKNAREMEPCRYMQYGKQFTEALRGWSSFKDRTPDLIRYDTTLTDCPYPAPKEGSQYAGIITFMPRKDKGVAENRLTFKGYGKSKPVASNDTEEGRQQNRRVECVLK